MHQPLAYIDSNADIARNVVIEPFVTIEKDVVIGKGTWIGSNVTIMEGARIGENCRIFPGAVISAIPQDLKFQGEKSLTIIGDNCTIRECSTINRGTLASGKTTIGNNCLIMAYAHIAHDCKVGNNCIIVNSVAMGGHVKVGDHAIIGGLSVLETVSVIIQVISFKLTGKRIFKMAPIHHHFEKKGWAESTIVIRFWIIAIILALVGLATLKLR